MRAWRRYGQLKTAKEGEGMGEENMMSLARNKVVNPARPDGLDRHIRPLHRVITYPGGGSVSHLARNEPLGAGSDRKSKVASS
jgi:hypothetical protein